MSDWLGSFSAREISLMVGFSQVEPNQRLYFLPPGCAGEPTGLAGLKKSGIAAEGGENHAKLGLHGSTLGSFKPPVKTPPGCIDHGPQGEKEAQPREYGGNLLLRENVALH